jgi:hypothetical protein
MTITDALAILDSAYQGGLFKPLTPGLGEACRVVAEGYREAEVWWQSIPPTTTNRDGTIRPTAIAVDFDGCICTNAWPEIGEANVPLIAFLIRHKAHGGKLILWTCREGAELDKAVNWCWGEWGLKFDALNENLPSWKAMFGNDTRKLGADYYIDDKAVCVKARAALK